MKKIVFISHGAILGGAVTGLFDIAKRLKDKGQQVTIILPQEGPFVKWLEKEKIDYRIAPTCILYYCTLHQSAVSIRSFLNYFREAIGNIWHLPGILRELKPDLVILNSSTLLLSGFIAKKMGFDIVWHVREIISEKKSRWIKNLFGYIIGRYSGTVITCSEYARRDLQKIGISRAEVIASGVDLNRFNLSRAPVDRTDLLGLSGEKVVGFVGHICREKGWQTFLKAAFIVEGKYPQAKYLICGISSAKKKNKNPGAHNADYLREIDLFKKAVRGMKFEDKFLFLDQVTDMENVYPLMDCLVFATIVPETFGRVMVEAMGCGVPVVASDIGPTSEIVEDHITGYLFPPDNSGILAEKILNVLTGQAGCREVISRAREKAEMRYDIEKIFPEYMQAYGIEKRYTDIEML